MNDEQWVIVDTETDGLSNSMHIVEIGAQLMRGWEPCGKPFRVLLNHDVPIPAAAVAKHGYTSDYLCGYGLDPCEAHAEFRDYARGLPIVAHNLNFDWERSFLYEWKQLGLEPAGRRGFCTLMLARRVVFETSRHTLDELRECFGLKEVERHSALGDVAALVELSTRVFGPRLDAAGIRGLAEVLRFSRESPVDKCLNRIESLHRNGKSAFAVAPARPSNLTDPSAPSMQEGVQSDLQPSSLSLPSRKGPVTSKPSWRNDPATAGQVALLTNLGEPEAECHGLTKAEASERIARLNAKCVATPKQVAFLLELGESEAACRGLTKSQARDRITELKEFRDTYGGEEPTSRTLDIEDPSSRTFDMGDGKTVTVRVLSPTAPGKVVWIRGEDEPFSPAVSDESAPRTRPLGFSVKPRSSEFSCGLVLLTVLTLAIGIGVCVGCVIHVFGR